MRKNPASARMSMLRAQPQLQAPHTLLVFSPQETQGVGGCYPMNLWSVATTCCMCFIVNLSMLRGLRPHSWATAMAWEKGKDLDRSGFILASYPGLRSEALYCTFGKIVKKAWDRVTCATVPP